MRSLAAGFTDSMVDNAGVMVLVAIVVFLGGVGVWAICVSFCTMNRRTRIRRRTSSNVNANTNQNHYVGNGDDHDRGRTRGTYSSPPTAPPPPASSFFNQSSNAESNRNGSKPVANFVANPAAEVNVRTGPTLPPNRDRKAKQWGTFRTLFGPRSEAPQF